MSLELNSWPVISLQWYASTPNSLNEISRRIVCQEMWLWRLNVWISHLRWVRNEPKLDIRSLTTLLTFSLAPILFPPKPPCSTSCLMNMVVVGFHNKSFRSFILQASCSWHVELNEGCWWLQAYHLSRQVFVGNLQINWEPGRLNLKEKQEMSVN